MFFDVPAPTAKPVVLRPAALYDPGSDRTYRNTAVAVENGLITGLLPEVECPAEGCLELPEMTLLPGLIDAHIHLCLRGQGKEMDGLSDLSEEDQSAVLQENLGKNLQMGITTVRDLGCPAAVMRLLSKIPAVAGPRVVASGPALTVPGGHGFYFGLPLRKEVDIEPALNTLTELGADLVKIMVTGGNSTPGTDVDACQFSEEFFSKMVQAAHARGKKVACHAHGLAGIWQCIRAGVDSVEHGSYMDGEAETALAAAGIFYIATICPGKLLHDLPPVATDRVRRRWELISRGAECGVRFGAGTDAGIPGVAHGSLVHEVQELARLGLGPRRALQAATAENAELLGLSDCGRLAPGYAADFVAYRGDVTTKIELLESPAFVMRAGTSVPLGK